MAREKEPEDKAIVPLIDRDDWWDEPISLEMTTMLAALKVFVEQRPMFTQVVFESEAQRNSFMKQSNADLTTVKRNIRRMGDLPYFNDIAMYALSKASALWGALAYTVDKEQSKGVFIFIAGEQAPQAVGYRAAAVTFTNEYIALCLKRMRYITRTWWPFFMINFTVRGGASGRI